MDKNTQQDGGRGGDVQARQSEDGTFELVVSDSAAHAAVSEAAAKHDRDTRVKPAETELKPSGRVKRIALIALVVGLLAGVLIYAFWGDEEGADEFAEASESGGADGFQPYEGGGSPLPASANAAADRLRAAEREEAARLEDRSPEPMPAQAIVQPEEPGRDDDGTQPDEWELDEAELLEEARAAERAERAAAQVDEDLNPDVEEPEQPLEDPQGDAQDEESNAAEQQRNLAPLRRQQRGQRILKPRIDRDIPNRLNRFRAAPARKPLRGLRGLQRRQEQASEPTQEQGVAEEEENWNEGEASDDRVPEFGRD